MSSNETTDALSAIELVHQCVGTPADRALRNRETVFEARSVVERARVRTDIATHLVTDSEWAYSSTGPIDRHRVNPSEAMSWWLEQEASFDELDDASHQQQVDELEESWPKLNSYTYRLLGADGSEASAVRQSFKRHKLLSATAGESRHVRKRKRGRSLNPTISIVVPVRDEAANLSVILPLLPAVHELIVVDGHSIDGSIEVARAVRPEVLVVRQSRRGKGNALTCGFMAASGDIIVTFDADGSADPAEITQFVDALVEGADYAKGSRYLPGGGNQNGSTLRKWGASVMTAVANLTLGSRYTDIVYGYNAFWRDLLPVLELPEVDLDPADRSSEMVWGDGFEIQTVLNCRMAAADAVITEVASTEYPRIYGESYVRTFSDGARVLRTIAAELHRSMRSGRGRAHFTELTRARMYLRPRADLIEKLPGEEDSGNHARIDRTCTHCGDVTADRWRGRYY